MKKGPRLYRCSCGAQGTYDYIMEHAKAKGHKLNPCDMGEHEYAVVQSFTSTSGSIEILRCKNCGFRKKVAR